jgi:hypothetical protein
MFPRKVFLEEVNLQPEYAFRTDTEGATRNVGSYSLSNMQKSVYQNAGAMVIGATEQELTQIYNKFSKFRTVYPIGIDDDGNALVEEEEIESSSSTFEVSFQIDKVGNDVKTNSSKKRPNSNLKIEAFISIGKEKDDERRGNGGGRGSGNSRDGFESNTAPRKDGELSMKQKIEKYNVDTRAQPKNVALWKEFIEFQDQVFEESSHLYNYEDGEGNKEQKGPKKKKHRKALVEKKIAILEKALGNL